MYERILHRIQARIRDGRYTTTLHADDELSKDALTILDVESCLLTGELTERQRDRITGRWKYVVRGLSESGDPMEVVAKLQQRGDVVIITVYRAEEE